MPFKEKAFIRRAGEQEGSTEGEALIPPAFLLSL
jgi:hypothetical protein